MLGICCQQLEVHTIAGAASPYRAVQRVGQDEHRVHGAGGGEGALPGISLQGKEGADAELCLYVLEGLGGDVPGHVGSRPQQLVERCLLYLDPHQYGMWKALGLLSPSH